MAWRAISFSLRPVAQALCADISYAQKSCCLLLESGKFRNQSFSGIGLGHGRRGFSSFMVQIPAKDLWGGVLGVSPAGKKKGRGKRSGRKKFIDLNRGQLLGSGKSNTAWPGLNVPVMRGSALVQREQLPADPERNQEIIRMRDQIGKIRHPSLPPLLRGYSGTRFPGQSVGPPDPVADYVFDGFDTKVLEFKTVSNMTGTLGRKMRFSAFVVTGNKNGTAGFALAKALSAKSAIRLAKNKAAQRLMHVPLYEGHTVHHNMFAQYHASKVFIHKKEEGYGLRCHRVLKTICELLGIKNLHCKVEGSTKNIQSVTKAFFDALINQESHAELAERTGYYVVEMKKEQDYRPKVVAAPTKLNKEPLKDEIEDIEVDFDRLYFGGKVELPKKPIKWDYLTTPAYLKVQKIKNARRNQKQAKLLRLAGLA